jgi:hypothetical protein
LLINSATSGSARSDCACAQATACCSAVITVLPSLSASKLVHQRIDATLSDEGFFAFHCREVGRDGAPSGMTA